MKRSIVLLVIFLLSVVQVAYSQNSGYTFNDLMKVKRVGDPQISPDSQKIAFTIGDVKFDANRIVTHIYTVSIDGSNLKQLTDGDRSATTPRWSPDGSRIAFISNEEGNTSLWVVTIPGGVRSRVDSTTSRFTPRPSL